MTVVMIFTVLRWYYVIDAEREFENNYLFDDLLIIGKYPEVVPFESFTAAVGIVICTTVRE